MADIVSGLFGLSPNDILQQRNAMLDQRANQFAAQSPLERATAGFYRTGGMLAPQVAQSLGGVDPAMQEANERNRALSGIDLSDPQSILMAAQRTNDPRLKMQLGLLAQQAKTKQQEAMLAMNKDAREELKMSRDAVWKHEEKLAEIAQRAEAAKQRSEDMRLSREDREQARKESLALRRELAAGRMSQDKKPNIVTDAAGNVTLLDNQGNVIKRLDAAGKPSSTFEKNVQAKKQMGMDIDRTITELESATKDGGLIDKSTGSGAGALVDMAAGFIGKATPGAIAAGQMAPIYDLVLKMVPRFEGPQSDKDTATYKEAAGQLANPAIPNERKKAAGKEILRLMKQRKGQFVTTEAAAAGVEPTGNTVSFGSLK